MATHKKFNRLQTLKGSDFELGKDQPDIRGWDVRDGAGRKIGDVSELIFDAEAKKVRYLVIDIVDSRELDLDKRTVMVPIGLAELDPKDNDVLLHNVNAFQLRALPSYRKDDLGAKAEMAIATVFGRQYTSKGVFDANTGMQNDFYEHDHFRDHLMQGRRQQPYPAQEQRRSALSDAETSSLMRDAELGTPVSNLETGSTAGNRLSDADLRRQEELREEELRRRRKNDRGIF